MSDLSRTDDRDANDYVDYVRTDRWGGVDDTDREQSSTLALFAGDDGALDLEQRRALVALVKKRFITARANPAEWKALTENPRPIRSRLNDLFLDLHLDRDKEVAFKRQVVPEAGGRFPTLLHDTAWSREETLLLVYLRTRVRVVVDRGETTVGVDRADMLDYISTHRPTHATDHASEHKRAQKAIESLVSAGVLEGAKTGDQFIVSPAIEVLLPLEKLTELLGWLTGQNGSERDTAPDDTENTDDAEPRADEQEYAQ